MINDQPDQPMGMRETGSSLGLVEAAPAPLDNGREGPLYARITIQQCANGWTCQFAKPHSVLGHMTETYVFHELSKLCKWLEREMG
jgi:hypothetical protein